MYTANFPKDNELRDFPRDIFATACIDSATDTKHNISYLAKALHVDRSLIEQWVNNAPASRQPTRAEAVAAWQCGARYHQSTAINAFNDARIQAGIARCAQEKLSATEAILRDTLAELDKLKQGTTPERFTASNDPFICNPYLA